MIVDIAKYLIVGMGEELDSFFKEAQEGGFLEFISISDRQSTPPVVVQTFLEAIKILRKQPLKEPSSNSRKGALFAEQVATRVVETQHVLNKLEEERKVVEEEWKRLLPLGNFSIEELNFITQHSRRSVYFFCMKTDESREASFPTEVIYLNTEYDLDYFIAITEGPLSIPNMIEMRVDASPGELKNRIEWIDQAVIRYENELKTDAEYLEFLQTVLIEQLNDYHLKTAKESVTHPLHASSLFMVEVWVPKNKIHKLYHLIDGMALQAEPIQIDTKDRVPTHFENKGFGLVGEELIKLYDIPAVSDKDPSKWVMWFFACFFAIIVGDAGYGAIFLLTAYYLRRKMIHPTLHQRSLIKLFFCLSFTSIAWGILNGAYFGIHLSPNHVLNRLSPTHYLVDKKAAYHFKNKDEVYLMYVDRYPLIAKAQTGSKMLSMAKVQKQKVTTYPIVEDFYGSILMEFTLVVGILHLSLAFLRYIRRNIAGLGWIIFMLGGYLFFPSSLNATTLIEYMGWIDRDTAAALGLQCLCIGPALAVIMAFLQRRLKGLDEIAHTVQIFADVLSYLRLYALNLAGAIIAATFNQAGSGVGLFIGLIIILFGHSLNLILAFMGGAIHGLRLNFLEWYHYCFEGGGRLFQPLKKIKHR